MSKIENVLIGADPEAFLRKRGTEEIVSSIGLIPGSKNEPFSIGEGYAIQKDNILVEWCQPPTTDPIKFFQDSLLCREFIENIKEVKEKDLEVVLLASGEIDDQYLDNEEANLFGCDPDYNAWTLDQNPSPKTDNKNLRSAGGHIHIGYDKPDFDTSIALIKALDLYLTVPSVILDPDTRRRKLYGKAGAFRFKSYGVELRTLSNFWLKNQETVNWVFQQVQEAINFVSLGKEIDENDYISIKMSVNQNNKELARHLCEKHGVNCTIKQQELAN